MRASLLLALISILALTAYADGMIIPPHPEDPYPLVLNHYVNITVDDTYATFFVDQEFINNGGRDIEGTYVFPVREGTIKNFQIVVDGRVVEGRLMGKDEATELYHRYVMERKEASLLEYSGLDTFSAKVMLRRGEKVRVQISYEQVIKQSSGVYSVFYPLSPERYTTRPIDPVDIELDIKAAGDIGFIMSPTHNVSVSRASGKEAHVRYYSKEIPNRDFQVFYGVTERDYDVKTIANKKDGQGGYFMLFLYPSSPGIETMPKDVVYVIDTSGSMGGTKIDQAKRALEYGLDKLNEGDRFNIVTFSSETDTYRGSLSGKSSAGDAKGFVDKLEANGATNIQDALIMASSQFSSDDRIHIVVLLTDGEDTTGHSTRSIMDSVKNCNCRIFPFGVGADIDFELLDRLSNEHGDGIPTYIRSESELESSLTVFYNKIARPLLHNVKVSISGDGFRAYEVYPKKVPDIFYGSQIVLVGRYSGSGSGTAKITGTVSGEDKSFDYSISLPQTDSNQFVERTWAARKVGYLLDVIALEGETNDLKQEVVALATKYGIPSPYTAYVAVNEKGEAVNRSMGVADAAGGWGGMGNVMTTAAAYKSAESYSYAPPETKTIDDKTFVSVGGVWKDTSCGNTVDRKVEFGSNDYFSLVSNSQIARYLSVGDSVILCTDKAVMVTPGVGGTGGDGSTDSGVGTVPGGTAPGPSGTGNGGEPGPSLLQQLLPIAVFVLLGIGIVLSIILTRPHEPPGRPEEPGGAQDEALMYKTLSSDTRLDILKLLEDGEGGRTPSFISEKLEKSKATISEHLDRLVEAQLVEKEEVEGRKWVFYRLTPKGKSIVRKGG
jgi:Ca-activated chloride channel family protein